MTLYHLKHVVSSTQNAAMTGGIGSSDSALSAFDFSRCRMPSRLV